MNAIKEFLKPNKKYFIIGIFILVVLLIMLIMRFGPRMELFPLPWCAPSKTFVLITTSLHPTTIHERLSTAGYVFTEKDRPYGIRDGKVVTLSSQAVKEIPKLLRTVRSGVWHTYYKDNPSATVDISIAVNIEQGLENENKILYDELINILGDSRYKANFDYRRSCD